VSNAKLHARTDITVIIATFLVIVQAIVLAIVIQANVTAREDGWARNVTCRAKVDISVATVWKPAYI
jgi:hypothetical protein